MQETLEVRLKESTYQVDWPYDVKMENLLDASPSKASFSGRDSVASSMQSTSSQHNQQQQQQSSQIIRHVNHHTPYTTASQASQHSFFKCFFSLKGQIIIS